MLLEIIGLICRTYSLLSGSFAKEPYSFPYQNLHISQTQTSKENILQHTATRERDTDTDTKRDTDIDTDTDTDIDTEAEGETEREREREREMQIYVYGKRNSPER